MGGAMARVARSVRQDGPDGRGDGPRGAFRPRRCADRNRSKRSCAGSGGPKPGPSRDAFETGSPARTEHRPIARCLRDRFARAYRSPAHRAMPSRPVRPRPTASCVARPGVSAHPSRVGTAPRGAAGAAGPRPAHASRRIPRRPRDNAIRRQCPLAARGQRSAGLVAAHGRRVRDRAFGAAVAVPVAVQVFGHGGAGVRAVVETVAVPVEAGIAAGLLGLLNDALGDDRRGGRCWGWRRACRRGFRRGPGALTLALPAFIGGRGLVRLCARVLGAGARRSTTSCRDYEENEARAECSQRPLLSAISCKRRATLSRMGHG